MHPDLDDIQNWLEDRRREALEIEPQTAEVT
jgi:hypothetical protein